MKKYEVMYIIRPTVEKEDIKKTISNINNIFTSRDSKILELKELGLKDLAYEIEDHTKGYYVWLLVEASTAAVAEYNRVIRITEEVIRYIIIKEGE